MALYGLYLNSDTTEGRGGTYLAAVFTKPEDAVISGRGRGVMGGLSGVDVYELNIFEFAAQPGTLKVKAQGKHIWGYRKDNNGRWSHGWVDLRDVGPADPEYALYLDLKAKFMAQNRA